MSKPTRDDKITAIEIMIADTEVKLYGIQYANWRRTLEPGVLIALRQELARLDKRRVNLLTPKPRKPKTVATAIQIAGKTKAAKARNG